MKLLSCLIPVLSVAAFQFFAPLANASVLVVDTTSDITVSSSTTSGPIDSALGSNDGYIRVFGVTPYDRGVFEYSLAGLSPVDSISSISAHFQIGGAIEPGNVLIYGFSGTGTAGVADANLPLTQLGSFTVVGDQYNISLSTALLQSLVNSGATYLGLELVSTSNGTQFGPGGDFCSIEGASGGAGSGYSCSANSVSSLTVNYTVSAVPEPSTWAMMILGLLGIGFMAYRRKLRGSGQQLV